MSRTAPHRREEGFALIVVTAMFVAFALLATTVIDRSNATQQLDRQKATREKLSRISYAIIEYSLHHPSYPYPCPAAMDVAYTNASFGQSVTGCDSGTPSGLTILSGSTSVVRGMVPTKTLGLPDSDAFDAWNNRIVYAVDRAMTVAPANPSLTADRIELTHGTLGITFVSPDFLVMSYGKDKAGGTPKTMTSIAVTCGVDGTIRTLNCDDDRSFTQTPLMTSPAADTGTYFDDILSFYGRTE